MAAYEGRIDTLFVPIGVQQWGTFHEESRTVELHQEAVAGSEDLLDVAAMYTLMRRGTVYAVAPEQVPEHTLAAAIRVASTRLPASGLAFPFRHHAGARRSRSRRCRECE
jgi:hypothetical protein